MQTIALKKKDTSIKTGVLCRHSYAPLQDKTICHAVWMLATFFSFFQSTHSM